MDSIEICLQSAIILTDEQFISMVDMVVNFVVFFKLFKNFEKKSKIC